jgi:VWFA-related protein
MTPRLPVLAILALSLLGPPSSVLAQKPDAPKNPTQADAPVRESAEVVLVEVPVRVVDKNGVPVRGLQANQFELFDDGKKQDIVGFDTIDLAQKTLDRQPLSEALNPAARRHFLILFDLTFARPGAILAAQRAAKQFVLGGMTDRDFAAVATFTVEKGVRMLVTFSSDRVQLARAVDTLGLTIAEDISKDPLGFAFDIDRVGATSRGQSAGGGEKESKASALIETLQTMQQVTKARVDEYARGRVAALTQSFGSLARALDAVQGRKDVIYLSEGFESRLLTGTRETDQEREWLVTGEQWKVDQERRFGNSHLQSQVGLMTSLFRRSDCVVHAVDIAGLAEKEDLGSAAPAVRGENALFEIADATGGEVFRNANDFAGQLDRLIARTSLVYVLAFQPKRTGDEDKFHDLKVKVHVPGARISARAGYYERRAFRVLSPLERSLSAADIVANEIAVAEIPPRVLALPFPTETANETRATVPVLVEIPGDRLLVGQVGNKVSAEVYVYATDPEGRLMDFFAQTIGIDLAMNREKLEKGGLKYAGQLLLSPGDYRLRVLVRNADTGRAGLDVSTLHVPTFTAGQPYIIPPIFLQAATGGMLVRGRQKLPAGAAPSDDPLLAAGVEDLVPAALAAVQSDTASRVSVVTYHFGTESSATLRMAAQILSEEGRPLGDGAISLVGRSPVEADGRQLLLVSFSPGHLSPGRYSLRVIVQDRATGRGSQASAPFLVR